MTKKCSVIGKKIKNVKIRLHYVFSYDILNEH